MRANVRPPEQKKRLNHVKAKIKQDLVQGEKKLNLNLSRAYFELQPVDPSPNIESYRLCEEEIAHIHFSPNLQTLILGRDETTGIAESLVFEQCGRRFL